MPVCKCGAWFDDDDMGDCPHDEDDWADDEDDWELTEDEESGEALLYAVEAGVASPLRLEELMLRWLEPREWPSVLDSVDLMRLRGQFLRWWSAVNWNNTATTYQAAGGFDDGEDADRSDLIRSVVWFWLIRWHGKTVPEVATRWGVLQKQVRASIEGLPQLLRVSVTDSAQLKQSPRPSAKLAPVRPGCQGRCSEEGCEGPPHARGLCQAHYRRRKAERDREVHELLAKGKREGAADLLLDVVEEKSTKQRDVYSEKRLKGIGLRLPVDPSVDVELVDEYGNFCPVHND